MVGMTGFEPAAPSSLICPFAFLPCCFLQ